MNVIAHPALGLDYGDARIGVAATDPLGILAHPVTTLLQSEGAVLEKIRVLVVQRQIVTLVLGLPTRSDGSEGTAAEKVRRFGAQVAAAFPELPLHYVDEYMSTMSASAKLREAGKNAKKQKALIDQAAAVEILRTWMGD